MSLTRLPILEVYMSVFTGRTYHIANLVGIVFLVAHVLLIFDYKDIENSELDTI